MITAVICQRWNYSRSMYVQARRFMQQSTVPKNSLFKRVEAAKNILFKRTDTTQKILTKDFRLIYEGPLSRKIKIIKLFSMSTALLSVIAAPLLIIFGNEDASQGMKIMLSTTVVLIGITTTFMLHWITRVYVHKMFFHPATSQFAIETFNVVGMTSRSLFSASDVTVPAVEKAFSTFEVKNKKFFLHTELREAEQMLKYVKDFNSQQMESTE